MGRDMDTECQDQLNVLVIDDDADVRQLLVDIVSRREHQVVAAESAEEGLELLPYWTFQIAFIDQNLPRMEGLLLGEYLRSNNPDMMIALVTGQPDRQLKRKSRDLAIRFIPKPFSVHKIYEVLDDYQVEAAERDRQRQKAADGDFAPPIARFIDELAPTYDIPGVPSRIEDIFVQSIKRNLNDLRSVSRYNERTRVTAFAGLVAAKVLGLNLPKNEDGETPFEEYDRLMRSHGRRREFTRS
jgi:CheY-like chemotaxis protein